MLNLFLRRNVELGIPDDVFFKQLSKSRNFIDRVEKWMDNKNEWHTRTQIAR